jgi:hypothetical protein
MEGLGEKDAPVIIGCCEPAVNIRGLPIPPTGGATKQYYY